MFTDFFASVFVVEVGSATPGGEEWKEKWKKMGKTKIAFTVIYLRRKLT
jgi:hypothetical protein